MLAILGLLTIYGLAAYGRTVWESIVAICFGAAVLQLAWLGGLTLRQGQTRPLLTRKQVAWNVAVFIVLAVVAILGWGVVGGGP